jgi:beta-glucanase (GH16 family)/lysophospholipase L1-like esterase
MTVIKKFDDTFGTFDTSFWQVSDYTSPWSWNQTGWDPAYVDTATPGEVTLTFDGTDLDGKSFSGSEIRSDELFGYGTYEVEMTASDEPGVVSAFFLYTDDYFGATERKEIDIEFLGSDTSEVHLNYFYGDDKLANYNDIAVPLGFDAADGLHTYRIEWQPEALRWYADDVLLFEIEDTTAPLPIPDERMKIYASIWTGGEALESWHGPVDENATTQATYSAVSYAPYTLRAATESGDAISFAGHTEGFVVDLSAKTYMQAVKVLPVGDSLTVGFNSAPATPGADLDGYRYDLFEKILAGGGWIDYVGNFLNGPQGMMDTAHDGVSGKYLAEIVGDVGGASDFTSSLLDFAPDVVLFMAGTNDFLYNGTEYLLTVDLPAILANLTKAVDQFYAYVGDDEKYLAISTLAVKARRDVPVEYATFLNEGYSTVGGEFVVGDAGNGTHVGGIKSLVTSLQAQHPTLILVENPITTMDEVAADLIHYTDYGYQLYTDALFAALESEIGLTSGALGTLVDIPSTVTEVSGGEGGDRLGGDAGDNVLHGLGGADFIEGRAGADTLEGGAGGDVFAYGLDALDGTTDTITDYSAAAGDVISIGAIIDSFGWSAAEIAANVAVTDGVDGAEVAITTPTDTYVLARVTGVLAADVNLATTQFTQVFSPRTEIVGTDKGEDLVGSDLGLPMYGLAGQDNLFGNGGNDILDGGAGADRLWGGTGSDIFRFGVETFDSNRDVIRDFSIAEGDRIDLSPISTHYGWTAAELESRLVLGSTSAGGIRFRLEAPDGTYPFLLIDNTDLTAFLAADLLDLEPGELPDTGDDDGNLTLVLPDTLIDASEVTAVTVSLSGLDADASATVTLSAGGIDITQAAGADGDLIFDLTSLPDGPVTSAVTATDVNGNASTVSGPSLTLAVSTAVPTRFSLFDPLLAVTGTDSTGAPVELGVQISTAAAGNITELKYWRAAFDADDTDVRQGSLWDENGTLLASVTFTSTPGETGWQVADLDTPVSILADTVYTVSYHTDDNYVSANGFFASDYTDPLGMLTAPSGLNGVYTYNANPVFPTLSYEASNYWVDVSFELAPPPDTGDDDGNLTLALPDTLIDASEVTAVTVSLSGLDADASAAVTLSAGGIDITQAAGTDGDLIFDLTSLPDGPVTSSVTATDTAGNTATVSGPAFTLAVAPDTSADVDGNLAVIAPDSSITVYERTAVDFTVSGIDPDAAAVVTVSDGTNAVASAPLAADGTVTLDLTGLADGNLLVSVTATDTTGNIATVAGAPITLDTSAPTGFSLFDPLLAVTAADATGTTPVELGVRVSAAEAGRITELKYWRAAFDADDTDVRQGSLWDENGTLLASVTFTSTPGQTGWQVADLDTPVSILADTVYTASYHTDGNFVTTNGFFTSDYTDPLGMLTAPAGLNGVYTYDANPVFPTLSYEASNYWVDVTFESGSADLDDSDNTDTGSGDSTTILPGAIVGTENDDVITGNPDPDVIYGLGGNDQLIGNGGDDVIFGGDGNDFLRGGAGKDTLNGQAGADVFVYTLEALDGSTDLIDNFSGSGGEGDVIDLTTIVSAFAWTESEAISYVSFSIHSNGVYVELTSPEVTQTLANIRNIGPDDIAIDDLVFV